MTLRKPTNLEEAIFNAFWNEDESLISEKTWIDGAFSIERLFKTYGVDTPTID